MKKILCLIDSLGPGGAQRQLVGLATFLKERGYDVIVVCYYDNRFYVDELLNKGVPYVFLNKASNTTFRMWHVAKYIRRVKPNMVISYLETPSICACVANLFKRKFRLIVSERNTTQCTGRNENIRFNLFRLADYVVPNAFSQADYIYNTFPKLTNKVVAIPNFVDLQQFTPPVKRQRREVPEIIVAATIWASKNTIGFVDAVAQLKAKGKKFHISWYGKDLTHLDYFCKCQQKIKQLDVEDCLELKEKTTAIMEKYQEADCFCLPSFYEGTPNVICEAMACGLPVACSDVCDNSRYVVEGENGFLFDPHDTSSIAAAIEKMLSLEESQYESFCRNSRNRAETMLSKDKFVQSYMKLIEQ